MFVDAAVLLVGDEILDGRVRDANLRTVARALSRAGIPVTLSCTVRDSLEEIAGAAGRLARDGRLLVTTGGMGPTCDDITREAVARALGRGTALDEAAAGMIRDRYAARGRECPRSAMRQAMLPEGASPIRNPAGVAPGVLLRSGACTILMLPGVPREAEAILDEFMRSTGASGPGLRPSFVIRTWGVPESEVSDTIEAEGLAGGAVLSFLPRPGMVDVWIGGPRAGEAFERIHDRFRTSTWATDADSPQEAMVGNLLESLGARLSVAESCTGGALGGLITSTPGSSRWFEGGVVCYSDDVKERLLGVPRTILRGHGAVSCETASAMATGVARLLGTDAALAVTGVAGPGGGSAEKPVGTVWIAALLRGGMRTRMFRFGSERASVREAACGCALGMMLALPGEVRR